VTPRSGVTSGETISSKLNCDATWNNAPAFEGYAARIEELKREREVLARAARVPIDQVLTTLAARGVDRIDDFFDRNAAGVLTFRTDLQNLPVEISIALLRCLREGLGIMNGSP
jgi:hypothetical protein